MPRPLSFEQAILEGYKFVYDSELGEEGTLPIEDAPDYYPGKRLPLLDVIGENKEGLLLLKSEKSVLIPTKMEYYF